MKPGDTLMHLKKVIFSPEEYPTGHYYPFNQDVFKTTGAIDFHSPVAFLVGENGTGKSTLLRAICHRCGIHIWQGAGRPRVEANPYENDLYKYILVEWTNGFVPGSFFSSENSNYFARCLEEWAEADPKQLEYFGGKSLLTQSHGQSLMSLFRSRYRIKGLYILDEPETALSPKSQLEFLGILQEMSRAGHAQFIVATHSPILMACPNAQIYSFDHIPMKEIPYEDTDHYRIFKDFLNHRDRYVM